MRLLIAEDDVRLLKSLKHILEMNQYAVDAVSNGTDALSYAETKAYDALILDIMMPGLDGVEVLRRLRSAGIATPALFLTAKTEVRDRVAGLDAGADDYLPKPFATEELLARVRAMLRRKESFVPELMHFGDLSLNRSSCELGSQGKIQLLSGREYQIMELLMQRPGFVVSSDEIMDHVWGWDSNADVSVIWVHVSNLRKKIAALGSKAEIRFVRGAGYVLGEGHDQ